jgi:hypothetical protein
MVCSRENFIRIPICRGVNVRSSVEPNKFQLKSSGIFHLYVKVSHEVGFQKSSITVKALDINSSMT